MIIDTGKRTTTLVTVINIPGFGVTTKQDAQCVWVGRTSVSSVLAIYLLQTFSVYLARLAAIPSCVAGVIYIPLRPGV